jgi:hypothetical protein
MFEAKEMGVGVAFDIFFNHALLTIVVHSMGDTCEIRIHHYKNLLAIQIVVLVSNMILHDLDGSVKSGNLVVTLSYQLS